MNSKIAKVDWGYVPVDPDPDFDFERNQRIIKESIEKNERFRLRRNREYGSKLRERSGAIAQYLHDLDRGKTSSTVEQYFGRQELARLRGEEISQTIQAKISDGKQKEALEKAKYQKAVTG